MEDHFSMDPVEVGGAGSGFRIFHMHFIDYAAIDLTGGGSSGSNGSNEEQYKYR